MITNPLLEEKYRVQRQLTEEAGNDVRKYMENIQRIVAEVEEEYGVEFECFDPEKDRVVTSDSSDDAA